MQQSLKAVAERGKKVTDSVANKTSSCSRSFVRLAVLVVQTPEGQDAHSDVISDTIFLAHTCTSAQDMIGSLGQLYYHRTVLYAQQQETVAMA
jgi:hypothetical protein